MTLLTLLAALALAVFLCAILMGVTLVGVCRYGDRYPQFFERLKTLGALAAIKEVARIYLKALNAFLGKDVGFKQTGVVEETKFWGLYIEHLLLLYWFVATILVLSFRPVEPFGQNTSSLLQAAAFLTLLSINVASDAVSLLWTKRCIAIIAVPDEPLAPRTLFKALTQDIIVAVVLMIAVQFVSNGLYAVQVGHSDHFLDYMLDPYTALKPYAAVDPHLIGFSFPGQLVITCTTYIPSLLFYAFGLFVILLKPFYGLLFGVFDLINIDVRGRSRNKCSPPTYIATLAGVLGVALTALKYFIDAVR